VLNDHELESLLQAAREAGAKTAGYVMLRLPLELKALFEQWLEQHEPLKARHVMQRIFDLRGGKAYDATFGERMRGSGQYAELISQRFHLAHKRLGFEGMGELDCNLFVPPPAQEGQLSLF
jgi:DNA repair photolyase